MYFSILQRTSRKRIFEKKIIEYIYDQLFFSKVKKPVSSCLKFFKNFLKITKVSNNCLKTEGIDRFLVK